MRKRFSQSQKSLQKKNIKIFNNYRKFKIKKNLDITISAIPGIIGLEPTILMIKNSKILNCK